MESMEKTEWVPCPSCGEEWNKLRPCFYLDSVNAARTIGVCVDCAESIQGLDYAVRVLPLDGVKIETKWIGQPTYKEKRKDRVIVTKMLGNLTAKVSYGDLVFTVARLDSHHISFKEARANSDKRADNIFAAWSKMFHEMATPEIVLRAEKKEKQNWWAD